MIVKFKLSAVSQTRWYEYAIRFVLGGAMTVIAGLIADHYGPVVGGLFLAFPAIFPASATLVEKHVRLNKRRKGSRAHAAGSRRQRLTLSERRLGASDYPPSGLLYGC